MKSTIWISYDLGASGDYEGLYAWLDDQGARECGSSVAFVAQYDHGRRNLMAALEGDIKAAVGLNKRSRIYVIWRTEDRQKGRFLIGRRKGDPWDGYGQQGDVADDEA